MVLFPLYFAVDVERYETKTPLLVRIPFVFTFVCVGTAVDSIMKFEILFRNALN